VDDRLIEAGNAFEGMVVAGGAGVFGAPRNWWKLRNPFQPSWGEPYVEIAARMLAAVEAARDAARGHEAVLVSHQLPIWTLRLHVEGRRFAHDPRRRECGLASVTSVTYDGDRFVRVDYAEPAGATDPDAVPGA
jgi:broad specificity phosphatase PhoE